MPRPGGRGRPFRREQRGDRPRPPPHLKGREIGMFYARLNSQKRGDTNKNLGTLYISEDKKAHIQEILDSPFYKDMFVKDTTEYNHVQDSRFKREFLRVINESLDEKLGRTVENIKRDEKVDEILLNLNRDKAGQTAYLKMLDKRKLLPSFKMREEILEVIEANQVVVLSGETGCGKTTQVAQFILDDYIEKNKGSTCRILCTQPRRISAITVAERVAQERAEKIGNSVGYHIRLERRFPREKGSICYCTTGVVLKLMETDPSLSFISHLILDEIHERDVMSDFILALTKKVITKRKDLKLVLMSATLNANKFSTYFNNAPHITIPGLTFPVKEFFLEDVLQVTNYKFPEKDSRNRKRVEFDKEFWQFLGPHLRLLRDTAQYSRDVCRQLENPLSEEIDLGLIFRLIQHICKTEGEGAILVFVTGFAEISSLTQLLQESRQFPPSEYRIFPLHSQMPTVDQRLIFEAPPRGVRKIVIATNIAETSITIDDVVFVIDSGKIKMTSFDVDANTEILAADWVSLANANQRRGRAGRVKPGMCFHLYSKAREMTLKQYQEPEILRKRLEDVILTAKVLQLGPIEPFFHQLIDSPDPKAAQLSLELLKQMNALTDEEMLTPLGYHLAKLPMAPQMGKMILFGAIFSCLNPVLSVAATLDFKDAFQLPIGKEEEADRKKLQLANYCKSDHLLAHEVLRRFEECGHDHRRFCWEYFLSSHTLKMLIDMKRQFMGYLHEMNFVPDENPNNLECNRNSGNISLVKAVICAGLYPNVACSRTNRPPFKTPNDIQLKLHLKSVLASERYFDSKFLIYYKRLKSTSNFVHDASLIHPLPVIFFGDNFKQIVEGEHKSISISKNWVFRCPESTARIITELRERLNWFLEYKIAHPGPILWTTDDFEIKILRVIMELITCEEQQDFD